MIMISLPLWPTLAAIGSILVFVFGLFKLYDEEWKYAFFGTAIAIAVPAITYLCFYGVCMMFGGI